MNAPNQRQRVHNARRYFLQQCGVGLGSVALQSYLQTATAAETAAVGPLAERKPHHKAKAKNVIFLFMAGAPSHLDLLDRSPSSLS